MLYLFPVIDPDIGWHIKTGEYIANNYSLPEKDPFSYTSDNGSWSSFILKQYWLSQLIYYAVYEVGGWWGIIALRMTIYLSIILIFIRFSKELNLYLRIGLVGFLVFALSNYMADRPVALTLLFFSIVVYLIERQKYLPIPFIMIIWANSHGFFIMGDFLLFLYCIDSLRHKKYKIAFILISGILASFINPNGWQAFIQVIYANPEYYRSIAEYQSPLHLFIEHKRIKIAYYGLALSGIFLLLIPRVRYLKLPEVVTIVVFLALSLKHIRAAPFIALFLSFISVKHLQVYNTKLPDKLPRVDCLAMALLIFITGMLAWDKKRPVDFNDLYYPRSLIRFFREARPLPNIYNHYNIGGFMIFALYPDYKVFIDPRGMNFNAIKDGEKIETASGDMDALIKKYEIKTIVTRVLDPFVKRVSPLIVSLFQKNEWRLVFLDGTIAVFVKDIPEHSKIISDFEMEKEDILRTVVRLCGVFLMADKGNANLYFILGATYERLKMYEEALQAYEAGVDIKDVPEIRGKIRHLRDRIAPKSGR